MKYYFILVLCLLSISITAQTYTTHTTLQSVVRERQVSLNGSARASLGGRSRTVIPVSLPRGTKSWYYSFSTSKGESGTKNLNLLLQLTSLLADRTGITKAVLSEVKIPAGSMSIDAYVFDKDNADLFMSKADLNGGTFYYWREGAVTNTRHALVPISNITSGTVYIGLKNPSMLDGINITIEAVAEVNESVYEDTWTSNNVDMIYNNCLERFAVRNTETEQVCRCAKDKMIASLTPSRYNELSVTDRGRYYEEYIAACSKETGNISVINKNNRIREIDELLRGQIVTKDYQGAVSSMKELIDLGVNNWNVYSGLGYYQLCLKKYEEAKKSLTIGLGKAPTELFLLGNLGDYYLLTGQYNQAIEIFLKYTNKRLADKRRFKTAVAEDLEEFERLGINNPDFERVRKELGIR